MGETGCLKDGHFQNLEVDGNTIMSGKLTLTNVSNVNRSARTSDRYYLDEYFHQLPSMESPVAVTQSTNLGTTVISHNKHTKITTGSDGSDVDPVTWAEFTFTNQLITANSIVLLTVIDAAGNTDSEIRLDFSVSTVQSGSCEIRAVNNSAAAATAQIYMLGIIIDPHVPSNLNLCIADSTGASAVTAGAENAGSACDESVTWGGSTSLSRAGINLKTSARTGDSVTDKASVVLLPRGMGTSSQLMGGSAAGKPSAWTGVLWGTENQVEWECALSIANKDNVAFWAGLKITNTPEIGIDDDQIYFIYDSDDSVAGTLATNTVLHCVCSIGDVDNVSALDITVADDFIYRLKIIIHSDRTASIFVNGVQYNVTTGTTATGDSVTPGTTRSGVLTDNVDLNPIIGVQSTTAAADTLTIYYQAINRYLFE